MAYNNETDEISKAVEAHISQEGDLRHEIDDSLREKSVVKDPPVYPVHSLPMDKAAINTPSFESQQLLRQYNRPISEFDHYGKQHPALPHDLHEKHEYDKRKVYRNPDDMFFHYHRQFQEYNEDRLRRPPHPLDSYDGLLPPQNSYPFEFSGHMHRKNRDEWYPPRPLPPPPIQRNDEVPFLPKIRPAHNKIFPDIRRKAENDEILIPYKHPDEFYLHQKRRTSPPRFTTKPRAHHKSSRRLHKKIRSRIYEVLEEDEEVSFDDMFLEHKRNQDSRYKAEEYPFLDQPRDRISEGNKFLSHHERRDFFTRVNDSTDHEMLSSARAPLCSEKIPTSAEIYFPPSYSLQDQQPPLPSVLPTSVHMEPKLTPSEQTPSHELNYTREKLPDSKSDNEEMQMLDNEAEHDDDDEELLRLRQEALVSAIERSKTDNRPSDQSQEEEHKPRKRKSKATKEKKKTNRKDKKAVVKLSDVDIIEEELVPSKSPDLSKSMRSMSNKPRSPEKDFTDPKILTLGNEVMKQKIKQEQAVMRQIREINNPEEGCKQFIDLIKTKNDREDKKKKMMASETSVGNQADNYDEIEMDMDDSIKPSNIVLDSGEMEETQTIDDEVGDLPCVESNEVESIQPPSQESIWKLLDGGFSSSDPPDHTPVSDDQTPAEKLISSIRANMFSLSDKPEVRSSDELILDSNHVLSPKSPCSETVVPYSSLTNHEVTSLPILNDASSTAFNNDKEPSVSDRKSEFTSNSKKEKRYSVEDEEELRARLLRDMAMRRAKETNKLSEPSQEQDQGVKVTESSVSKKDVKDGKKNKNSSELFKRYLAKRKELERKRKPQKQKNRMKMLSSRTPARKFQIPTRIKQTEIATLSIHASPATVLKENTTSNNNKPLSASMSQLSHSLLTSTATSTTASVLSTAATTNTTLTISSTAASLACKKVSPPASIKSASIDQKPSSPASLHSDSRIVYYSRSLPQSSQSAARVHHVTQRSSQSPVHMFHSGQVPSVQIKTGSSNVPRHPPVVISFDQSSDEDDDDDNHVTSSKPIAALSSSSNQASKRIVKLITQSNIPKSSSSPNLFQPDSDRKRKSPRDENEEAKRLILSNASHAKKLSVSIQPQIQLNEFGEKLEKVTQLLAQDKAQLDRLDQKKTAKQKDLNYLSSRITLLKRELEKAESAFSLGTSAIEKMKKDTEKISSTMKKRVKLQSMYVRKIDDLHVEVSKVKTTETENTTMVTTSDSLPTTEEPQAGTEMSPNRPKQENINPLLISSSSTQPIISSLESADEVKAQVDKVAKTSATKEAAKQEKLHQGKALLLEKERNLKLQKEKYLLKQTEYKLLLIKRKAKQALKAKKSRKHSDQSFYLKQLKKRRSSLTKNQNKFSLLSSHKTSVQSSVGSDSPLLKSLKKRSKRRTSLTSKSPRTNKQPDKKPISSSPITSNLEYSRTSSSSDCNVPDEAGSSHSPIISCMNSDDLIKLKRNLNQVLSPMNFDLFSSSPMKYSFLVDMHPSPMNSSWLINAIELTREPTRTSSTSSLPSYSSLKVEDYSSPLKNFRSYRLCSFFPLDKSTGRISSDTFSHQINCNKIFCRYDLTGKCLDEKCKGQHVRNISQSPSSLYLDLLWYCPQLLKTNDGEQITVSHSLDIQLQAASDTVTRLCPGSQQLSVEETCSLLVKIIQRALGNKRTITSVFGKKRLQVGCHSLLDDFDDEQVEKKFQINRISDQKQVFDTDFRYYDDDDEVESDIDQLKSILNQNPTNERARIKLAHAYLNQSQKSNENTNISSIEIALHTLCLGIELNDQSEELWSAYIPILRLHYERQSLPIDKVEILDKVLLLMPLCRTVWLELFKWKWSFTMLSDYFNQLIDNLFNRHKILNELDLPDVHEYSYFSSWLLLTVVEKCHLMLHGRSLDSAIDVVSNILDQLDCSNEDSNQWRPLSVEDAAKLWLIRIHLTEHGKLPSCLYDQDASKHMFGMNIGFDDVILSFSSPPKAKEKIRELFSKALACCSESNESMRVNGRRLYSIYQSMINFEVSLRNWSRISEICKDLVKMDETNTEADSMFAADVYVTWVEALMHSGDVVAITQVFDDAVTACPQSPKLSYMAALYQLNSDSSDEEAARQYLENYLGSIINLEGAEDLSSTTLHQWYRRILRHNVNVASTSKLLFYPHYDVSLLEKQKPYIWLIYCLLTELKEDEEATNSKHVELSDLFEASLHILPTHEDRKIIWIQYLLHLRSNALNPSSPDTSAGSKKAKRLQRTAQLTWFKRFTSVVRRCLTTTPCKFNVKLKKESDAPGGEEKITDYSFHNEVALIYLNSFSSNQRAAALSILTDTMPTNIPLLKRAASFFLRDQDPTSAVSLLWRVTSTCGKNLSEVCKDYQLWKMAGAGLLAEKKHRKALHLYNLALSILPRNKDLWLDEEQLQSVVSMLSLTLAYNGKDSLQTISQQCKAMLSLDLNSLAEEILSNVRDKE